MELLKGNVKSGRTELVPLGGWAGGASYCRNDNTENTSFLMITCCNLQKGSHIFHAHKLSKNIPNEVRREINFKKGHKQDSSENSSEALIV